jgi:hypothetical protein
VNGQKVLLYDGVEWTPVKWKDVRVGDILKIRNNETIPADMVVLHTSDKDGLAYLETANLDGYTVLRADSYLLFAAADCSCTHIRETNLKVRQALEETTDALHEHSAINSWNGSVASHGLDFLLGALHVSHLSSIVAQPKSSMSDPIPSSTTSRVP